MSAGIDGWVERKEKELLDRVSYGSSLTNFILEFEQIDVHTQIHICTYAITRACI